VKETLIDVMNAITPYMMYAACAGAALLAIGIFAWLLWLVSGWGTQVLRFSGRLLVIIGLIFLVCQGAAMVAEMPPVLNLGDAGIFGLKTQPYWIVGLVFLIPGMVLRIFGAFRPTH